MARAKPGATALLVGCLSFLSSAPTLADDGCRNTATIAEDRAACIRATCTGLAGKARRACERSCRPAAIRVLAYAVTTCRQDTSGIFQGTAEVRIRRGDCPPVTVFRNGPGAGTPNPLGFPVCRAIGEFRAGNFSMVGGPIPRIGVSRDGSQVVFEVTDDFSVVNPQQTPPDREGIYLVRADGSGLRRLGPASRDPSFRFAPDPRSVVGYVATVDPQVAFSPDGRRILFSDRGPGPDGEAVQLVTIELASGRRTQLTRLPPAVPPDPWVRDTGFARFTDDKTVLFGTFADADGAHPAGDSLNFFRVRIDGTGLRALASPVALPGSRVVPIFQVAGGAESVVDLALPGTPVDSRPFYTRIVETFLAEGRKLLQLTRFGRTDTHGELLSVDRRRVFLRASADPFGTNPAENCQLFSIDTRGGHLRQLTHFGPGAGQRSPSGCLSSVPPGCEVSVVFQDPVTKSLVFYSGCDPLGTNPNGAQLFAMRPDGTGLRQLTLTRGLVIEGDGTVTAELPGPFWYSGKRY